MSDILSRWNDQQKEEAQTPKAPSPHARGTTSPVSEFDNARELPPSHERSEFSQAESAKFLQFVPHLSGKLADHLSKESPRQDFVKESPIAATPECTLSNSQELAATATALILASNIARFSGTALSEDHLKSARDKLIQCFNPKDAVKLEVEAYEILQWFAGAIDSNWRKQEPAESASPTDSVTSEDTLIKIIQHAIDKHRDLEMHYYTGSRGEFSERRITPIEITAEKYLIAFCHLRQEERVFRLSRILKLAPLSTDITDESDTLATLCYPSAEDTKLPPLPQIESPAPSYKTSKQNHSTNAPHRPKAASKKAKSDSTQDDSPLFKFAKSNKDKAPQKKRKVNANRDKAKSHGQSTLPGFNGWD